MKKNKASDKQDNKADPNNTQMSSTSTSLHLITYCMLKINKIISSSSTIWYFHNNTALSITQLFFNYGYTVRLTTVKLQYSFQVPINLNVGKKKS